MIIAVTRLFNCFHFKFLLIVIFFGTWVCVYACMCQCVCVCLCCFGSCDSWLDDVSQCRDIDILFCQLIVNCR